MLNISKNNTELLSRSMYDCLAENADQIMDKYAMEYFNIHYTYKRLFDMIKGVRKALTSCGIRRGDRVAIAAITTPETVALTYACSALGVSLIMLDVRYNASEIIEICRKNDVKMLFDMDWNVRDLKAQMKNIMDLMIVVVSPVESMPAFVRFGRRMGNIFQRKTFAENDILFSWNSFICMGESAGDEGQNCHDGDTEICFSTSGTTGKRKLVVLTNNRINLAVSQHFIPEFSLSAERSFLSVMPIFACYGMVTSVHCPLCLGMEMIIYPIFNCDKIPQIIASKKPDYFAGVPAFYEKMLTSKYLKDADLSFLKGLLSGGESISAEKETRINTFLKEHGCNVKLSQGYGMTEVAAGVCLQREEGYEAGTVGGAFGYASVKIVKQGTTEEAAPGENGEICLNTPCMMTGYLGDQDATDEVIKLHDDGIKWIHTGDIGHYTELGNLQIEGRIKKMMVTENGTKIFPNYIEGKITDLDCVFDCAVVPMKKDGGTCVNRIKIYVVPEMKENNTEKSIKNMICKMFEADNYRFIAGGDIEIIKSIPVTGFGKHDYQKLQEMAA